MSINRAERLLARFFADRGRASPGELAQVVISFAVYHGVLSDDGFRTAVFAQPVFRDYFAAEFISSTDDPAWTYRSVVKRMSGEDQGAWEGAFRLLLGILGEAGGDGLMRLLSRKAPELAGRVYAFGHGLTAATERELIGTLADRVSKLRRASRPSSRQEAEATSCIEALGDMATHNAIARLGALIGTCPSWAVYAIVFELMVTATECPSAAQALVGLMRRTKDTVLVTQLGRAIRAVGGASAIPMLEAMIATPPSAHVLVTACEVLARLRPDERTVQLVIDVHRKARVPRLLDAVYRALLDCETADAECLGASLLDRTAGRG